MKHDGLSCAFGVMISDEDYREELEDYSYDDPDTPLWEALRRSGVDMKDERVYSVMENLMEIHDTSSYWVTPMKLERTLAACEISLTNEGIL